MGNNLFFIVSFERDRLRFFNGSSHPLPTGRQASLSPAFAEAASRRQATGERRGRYDSEPRGRGLTSKK